MLAPWLSSGKMWPHRGSPGHWLLYFGPILSHPYEELKWQATEQGGSFRGQELEHLTEQPITKFHSGLQTTRKRKESSDLTHETTDGYHFQPFLEAKWIFLFLSHIPFSFGSLFPFIPPIMNFK